MGASQFKHSNGEREGIVQALDEFFRYLDHRQDAVTDKTLPPVLEAFDVIVGYYTIRLKNVVKEELLINLECFCRFMQRMPVELVERELNRPEYAYLVVMREFFKFFGFANVFRTGDEALRYRYRLLQEFFNQTWASLSVREQKFITLFAKTRHSLASIARAMNLQSIAAVQAFQRRCFQAVTKTFYALLITEAERPGLEPRRQAVIQEWVEHFRRKTMTSL